MTWPAGSHPGGSPTLDSGTFLNAFQLGETIAFSVANYAAAAAYEVRNYYGAVVTAGLVAGSTITLSALPLGWYKLYVTMGTPAAAPWGSSGAEACFCVVRSDAFSPLIDRPTQSQPFTVAGGDIGAHIPARGYFGIGPFRHKINTLADTSGMAGAANEIEYELQQKVADTARPFQPITGFPNGYNSASGTEQTNLTSIVQACVAKGGVWFEGRNEPNTGIDFTTYSAEQNAFAARVHAASASAKVMGPCPLALGGDATSGSGGSLYWINNILPLVGSSLDGISFHNYDGQQGDLAAIRNTFDKFVAVLVANGQQNKPRFQTEFGSTWAAVAGSFEPRFQAKNTMLDLHVLEQYGVPKEHTYLFYDLSHGFWGFPAFWIMRESGYGQPTPVCPLIRVWSEELFGKTFSARLNFGSEDNYWIGSRFTGSDGSSVVTLQSSGNVGTIKLTVTGASTVDTVDPWGNVTSRPVMGGVVSVPVDELPSYVRCPSGVSATPVALNYGVNVPRTPFSTATASSNVSTASLVINLEEAGVTADWIAADSTLPAWLEIDLPGARRFNRVGVICPSPHNLTCALLDFDVQAWNATTSTWDVIATAVEPTPFKMWTSNNDAGGNFVDSWYSRRSQWLFRLAAPLSTTKLRIYVRNCTFGGSATTESYQGNTVAGSEIGQGGPKLPTIREIRLTLNEYDLAGKSTPNAPLVAIA